MGAMAPGCEQVPFQREGQAVLLGFEPRAVACSAQVELVEEPDAGQGEPGEEQGVRVCMGGLIVPRILMVEVVPMLVFYMINVMLGFLLICTSHPPSFKSQAAGRLNGTIRACFLVSLTSPCVSGLDLSTLAPSRSVDCNFRPASIALLSVG